MGEAHHESFERRGDVKGGSERSFGLVFAVVFVVISVWPLWDGLSPRWWGFAVALTFAGVAIFAPAVLQPLNRLWTRLGGLLHRVVSPVILAMIFYLVITPFGVVMRLAGKDPLRLQRQPGASSYWIERRPPGPAPETMKNQF